MALISAITAISSRLNLVRTPRSLLVRSVPCISSLLMDVSLSIAEQSKTTRHVFCQVSWGGKPQRLEGTKLDQVASQGLSS